MKIYHHTKYKEIHGEDKIVLMESGEHQKLHRKLRKEGKCNIPVDQMHTISEAAHYRTGNWKKYIAKNIQAIDFYETMMSNVRLAENLRYNHATENLSWNSRFQATNGKELIYVESE